MTPQQLKNKRAELEQWLIDNPNHTNRIEILSDLRKVIDKLLDKNIK